MAWKEGVRASIIAFVRRRLPREGRILLALLAAVLGMWLFLWLASQVTAGRTRAFDEKILLFFRRPDDLAPPGKRVPARLSSIR